MFRQGGEAPRLGERGRRAFSALIVLISHTAQPTQFETKGNKMLSGEKQIRVEQTQPQDHFHNKQANIQK